MKLVPSYVQAVLIFKSWLFTGMFAITTSNEIFEKSTEEFKGIATNERRDDDNFNALTNFTRLPRNVSSIDISNSTSRSTSPKSKTVLVKKPIPKFSETESEEDYQGRVKHPVMFSGSMENEDEDFSIDDYDFDVQHDEFAGRGKPLQPRTKLRSSQVAPKSRDSMKQKIVITRNIKESNAATNKDYKDKDDYDDDDSVVTTTSNIVKTSIDSSDDYISEEGSKEYEGKASVRTARSSLNFGDYFEKFGEKTSAVVAKLLSFLPIFPQLPESSKIGEQ